MPPKAEITPDNNNLPTTIPPIIKDKPDLSKLTPYEIAAVTLKTANPDMGNGQIGRKLKELGLSKNDKYIYNRLGKNDYLNRELAEIENKHRETMLRETYPKAEKVVEEALDASNRKLKLKDKLGYVKLVYDKVHGETHRTIAQQTMNIANIERLQVVIGNDLAGAIQPTPVE